MALSTRLIQSQACYQWAKAEGEEMVEALSKALTGSCPASPTIAASREFREALVKRHLLKQNPLSEYLEVQNSICLDDSIILWNQKT